MDGAELYIHGNGQDQLGQTFMYGAKGGEAYMLGNAAGRL